MKAYCVAYWNAEGHDPWLVDYQTGEILSDSPSDMFDASGWNIFDSWEAAHEYVKAAFSFSITDY